MNSRLAYAQQEEDHIVNSCRDRNLRIQLINLLEQNRPRAFWTLAASRRLTYGLDEARDYNYGGPSASAWWGSDYDRRHEIEAQEALEVLQVAREAERLRRARQTDIFSETVDEWMPPSFFTDISDGSI